MTIPPDLEAQILRYYHVEKWRVGTIARQLHVHHGTVARVLAQAGLPRIGPPARRSQVEPYLPFIHQTLEKFPTLTASRLYAMVCERGYRGSGDHFRHLISTLADLGSVGEGIFHALPDMARNFDTVSARP